MRNAMLINEKDNVIVAIEPLSKGTKAVSYVSQNCQSSDKSRKRNYQIWRVHWRSSL